VFDDYRNIRPTTRLIAQLGAALVLAIPAGYQVTTLGALGDLGPWSLPFTVLVMVTFMNACNMVDGADGLLGCALLPMFAALSIVCLQPLNWGTAMMGALVFGFLFFNWPGHHYREKRRRIFLGNGGVMFVATMSVGMLVRSVDSPDSPLTPGSAPWLTMIPLLELATSVVRRSMKKVSPIHSDRDHIHHRLLEQGVTPVTLAVGYLVFSTLCSAIAVVGPLAGVPDVLMWAGAATVLTIAAALEFWRAIRSVRSVSGLQDAQDGGDAREG
jgi:UDP-GlcNAc:undecaprenyl-phosphate GlcNAc-1-phosphate transferase